MLPEHVYFVAGRIIDEETRWLKQERAGEHPSSDRLKESLVAVERLTGEIALDCPGDEAFAEGLDLSVKNILELLKALAGKSVFSNEGARIIDAVENRTNSLVSSLLAHSRNLEMSWT